MNMFQRKFLKLQCKKTAKNKEEIIRLHSDLLRFFWVFCLTFLRNTYEGHSFQKRCRQDHTKYEVLDVYIWKNLIQDIHIPKQTMLVFYVKTKFKPQATGQKRGSNLSE